SALCLAALKLTRPQRYFQSAQSIAVECSASMQHGNWKTGKTTSLFRQRGNLSIMLTLAKTLKGIKYVI
ncbi:hypothetical protein, partial [Pseudomonas amygdali]|uniref:hypothetical protein n=1 Tax=Pseudomonas amygdali TaxID=47877 RepID=UPI001E5B5EF5